MEHEQILDAPVAAQRNLKYAGFWIRVGAYLLDVIILAVINFFMGLMSSPDYSMLGGTNIILSLVQLCIGVIYFSAMESSTRQATLGKMAVGIKVGDANGEQVTFGNALGRYFAKILSGLILFIGFMMVGWDPKKQGLHDRLADTYVFYA
jgi:uncharacterized RDD family membrane protein YckC